MATESALGRKRALAKQRIEAALNKLGEGREFTLPTFSRHGQGVLLVNQLEAIADFLDGGAGVESIPEIAEPTLDTEPTDDPTPPTEPEPEGTDMSEPELEPSTSKYAGMTVKELKKLAKEHGGLMASLNEKSLLIEALEAADNAAEQANT